MRSVAPAPPSTIHDFVSGRLYGVMGVARVFGRSDQWVREMIGKGKLSGARLDGRGPWLVSGESVLVLWGSLQLAADLLGPPEKEETEDAVIRRAQAKLDKLNRKPRAKR